MQLNDKSGPEAAAKPFLDRLKGLFCEMDRAYDTAAARYGFECSDCADNCCLTHFYHHTYAEYLYIQAGVSKLGPQQRRRVLKRASDVVKQAEAADRKHHPLRLMCPANAAQRCLIYAHRPMICRLHGVAHQLISPRGETLEGPGCEEFSVRCAHKAPRPLDRTPFYLALSRLERDLRQRLGVNAKIKMTVAEMIVAGQGETTTSPRGT